MAGSEVGDGEWRLGEIGLRSRQSPVSCCGAIPKCADGCHQRSSTSGISPIVMTSQGTGSSAHTGQSPASVVIATDSG